MPYAILRFQKRKAGSVAACERHNERKKEAYKSNPDIDMERSKYNYHLVPPPRYTYKKDINRMVQAAGCKVRKDSVMMVETLITASPEFMNSLPPEEQKAYFALTPAVELSFLKKDEQENLRITMESEDATPSLSQAQRMKKLSQMGRLDMDTIFAIMTEEKANQKETVKIGMDKLRKYFPRGTTPKQIEDTILRLLERELQRKRNRDSR